MSITCHFLTLKILFQGKHSHSFFWKWNTMSTSIYYLRCERFSLSQPFPSRSKVSRDTLYECVNGVLNNAKVNKKRFLQTVELQIGLKNYDPQKDKRFSGTVKYVSCYKWPNLADTMGHPCPCLGTKSNHLTCKSLPLTNSGMLSASV